MKLIFNESGEAVKHIMVKWFDEEDYRVRERHTSATPITEAHYHADLRVLVVDQRVLIEGPSWVLGACRWEQPDRRTLETVDTEALAIRRAVALADEWADRLSKTVFDDERDASEVEAAYAQSHGEPLAF